LRKLADLIVSLLFFVAFCFSSPSSSSFFFCLAFFSFLSLERDVAHRIQIESKAAARLLELKEAADSHQRAADTAQAALTICQAQVRQLGAQHLAAKSQAEEWQGNAEAAAAQAQRAQVHPSYQITSHHR
jgi:hypothetical protein